MSLKSLAKEAAKCRRCPLYKRGTQTVFGEGKKGAALMFVGEQPGDREDIEGKPFVGPAGNLLNELLEELAIDRAQVYVTNAVKHFKWVRSGKKRLHQKPVASEIEACRVWLEGEIANIHPKVLVCLGATAARSVLGKIVAIGANRGSVLTTTDRGDLKVFVTWHPSAILRSPRPDVRHEKRAQLKEDLRKAWTAATEP